MKVSNYMTSTKSFVLALLILLVAVSASAQTIQLPGHYLIPFGGVVYTHTQPATVTVVNGTLVWHIDVFDTNGVYQGSMITTWGLSTDTPLLPADYDGDGYDDLAVYRHSDHTVYVRRSHCDTLGFWGCYYILRAPQ